MDNVVQLPIHTAPSMVSDTPSQDGYLFQHMSKIQDEQRRKQHAESMMRTFLNGAASYIETLPLDLLHPIDRALLLAIKAKCGLRPHHVPVKPEAYDADYVAQDIEAAEKADEIFYKACGTQMREHFDRVKAAPFRNILDAEEAIEECRAAANHLRYGDE